MGYLTRALIRRKWESNRRRDAVRLALQPLPTGVEVLEGLPYLSGGHPMHTLNLYRPLGAEGPLPVVVDIHGGGWMYGDRELNRAYCMYLASQGWAVMGMSYRLLPEVDLRGQVQDVFASFRWLEHHGGAWTGSASPGTPLGDIWPGWPPAFSWTLSSRRCTEPPLWYTPSGPWPSPTGYATSTASTF